MNHFSPPERSRGMGHHDQGDLADYFAAAYQAVHGHSRSEPCEAGCPARRDNEWYEAIADALRIIGKSWMDDVTDDEDAFVLAYADTVAERPESEK